MTEAERHQLRVKTTSDLESLNRELAALEHQLKPIAPDCSLGDLLRSEMMHDQEVLNGAYQEAKKRYNSLLHAQKHLQDEEYGLCAECDEEIAIARLLIMPEARYCVDCANERDR